jgi:hypothetical protein
MKKIFLLLLLFGLIRTQAQKRSSAWSAGFSIGPSFPIGHFASKNYHSEEAGNAATGIGAEVTGGYAFNRSFGMVLLAGGQDNANNPILYQSGSAPAPVPLPMTETNAHFPHWKIVRILAGGVYTRPFSSREKLFLQIRLLAGVLKTNIPGYRDDVFLGRSGPVHIEVPELHMSWSLSYQADAGLKWKLSERTFLVACAGYSGARPVYPYFSTLSGFVYRTFRPRTVPITSIYLRAGVEVRL